MSIFLLCFLMSASHGLLAVPCLKKEKTYIVYMLLKWYSIVQILKYGYSFVVDLLLGELGPTYQTFVTHCIVPSMSFLCVLFYLALMYRASSNQLFQSLVLLRPHVFAFKFQPRTSKSQAPLFLTGCYPQR
jgi:hypothetical protein